MKRASSLSNHTTVTTTALLAMKFNVFTDGEV
jgi:hypothetical protein